MSDFSTGFIVGLLLENFKSFTGRHFIAPFRSFTAIMGPNGSGKSNVMDAIRFALTAPEKVLRTPNMAGLISHGSGAAEASVTLFVSSAPPDPAWHPDTAAVEAGDAPDFSDLGVDVVAFTRTTAGTLAVDGRTATKAAYTRRLSEHGLDPARMSTFVLPQDEIARLASQKPEDLGKLIDDLSGAATLASALRTADKTLDEARAADRAAAEAVAAVRRRRQRASRDNRVVQELTEAATEVAENRTRTYLLQIKALVEGVDKGRRALVDRGMDDLVREIAGVEEELRGVAGRMLAAGAAEREAQRAEREVGAQINLVIEPSADLTRTLEDGVAEAARLYDKAQAQGLEATKVNAELTAESAHIGAELGELEREEHDAIQALGAPVTLEQALAGTEAANHIDQQLTAYAAAAAPVAAPRDDLLRERRSLQRGQPALEDAVRRADRAAADAKTARDDAEAACPASDAAEAAAAAADARAAATALAAAAAAAAAAVEEKRAAAGAAAARLQRAQNASKDAGVDAKRAELVGRLCSRAGVRGEVHTLLRPARAALAPALRTALGRFGPMILVDTPTTAKLLIEEIRNTRGARFTFLPVTSLAPRTLTPAQAALASQPGLHHPSYLLAPTDDPVLQRLFNHCCGDLIVAEDLAAGAGAAYGGAERSRVVTLAGEVISKVGDISADVGASASATSGAEGASQAELQAELQAARQALDQARRELETAQGAGAQGGEAARAEAAAVRAEAAAREAQTKRAVAESRISAANASLRSAAAARHEAEHQLAASVSRDAEIDSQLASIARALTSLKREYFGPLLASAESTTDAADLTLPAQVPDATAVSLHTSIRKDFSRRREDLERRRAALEAQIAINSGAIARFAKVAERQATRRAGLAGELAKAREGAGARRGRVEELKAERRRLQAARLTAHDELTAAGVARDELRTTLANLKAAQEERAASQLQARSDLLRHQTRLHTLITQDAVREGVELPARVLGQPPAPLPASAIAPASCTLEEFEEHLRSVVFDFSLVEADWAGVQAEGGDDKAVEKALRSLRTRLESQKSRYESLAARIDPQSADQLSALKTEEAAARDAHSAAVSVLKDASANVRAIVEERLAKFNATFEAFATVFNEIYVEMTRYTPRGTEVLASAAAVAPATLGNIMEVAGRTRVAPTSPDRPWSGLLIRIYVPGKEWRPVSALSGGERAIVAAALALALGTVVAHGSAPSVLLLDEPDTALDRRNVGALAAALKRRAREGRQIVAVSLKPAVFMHADLLHGVVKPGNGVRSTIVSLEMTNNEE